MIYTVNHKNGANLFLSVTSWKINGFNAVFSVRFSDERCTLQCELRPPHLINVATLRCESRNSENVILQWDISITKENCIKRIVLHRNGPVDFKIWGVLCSHACMKQRSVTSMTCKNAWYKLELILERTLSRLRLTSGSTVWDHVCMVVADTLNTCCEIVVHLYYVVHQNILWNCQCNLVHLMAIS